jgi:hypothetical protein
MDPGFAPIQEEDLIRDSLDWDDPDREVDEPERRGKNLADDFLRKEIEEGLRKASNKLCVLLSLP